ILMTPMGLSPPDVANSDISVYLTKPVKKSQLHQVMADVLEGRTGIDDPRISPISEKFDPRMAEDLPLHILVVEDNSVNQKLVLHILNRLGYEADLASNGKEALIAVEHQRYDIIFMDVHMPEMDGLEATRRISRMFPPEKRPHIIAITALAMQGDRDLCISAGMDDYLTKPIHIPDLIAAMKRSRSADSYSNDINTGLDQEEPVLIDWSVISGLRDLQDPEKPDLVNQIIEIYLEDSLIQIQRIDDAIRDADPYLLQNAAHALKGSSRYVGAMKVFEGSHTLEQLGKKGSVEGACTLAAVLKRDLIRTLDVLRRTFPA
ncbi:MAG: response regulator, partial [Methanobacteriota archaeon]